MFGLDADDEVIDSYAWTDVIVGSNPRIEEDRAFVDVVDDMDGGDWTGSWSFYEGVYIAEDGGIGDYFVESEGEVTIYIEVEPDQWEATSELTNNDFQSMENVTMDNLIDGWKTSTRLVTWPDGWERHDVSVLTHAEYEDSEGDIVTVEFTSLTGYHQKFE